MDTCASCGRTIAAGMYVYEVDGDVYCQLHVKKMLVLEGGMRVG